MHQSEVLDGSLLQKLAGVAQVTGNVLHQSLLGAFVQNVHPEIGDLAVVVLRIAAAEAVDISSDWTARGQCPGSGALLGTVEGVREIVGGTILVVRYIHGSIPLEVLYLHLVGTVHRNLQIIRTQAMTMSVRVREQTTLEHLIGRGLNAGHQVSRTEGNLLHLRVKRYTQQLIQW